MIFQLPYVPFPENGPTHRMLDYDHFRPYFHSRTLHWSYGAMRGRETDRWQRLVAALPPVEMVDRLRRAGFSGVYLDRFGYEDDDARQLEAVLRVYLGTAPIVSADGRLCFFRISPRQGTPDEPRPNPVRRLTRTRALVPRACRGRRRPLGLPRRFRRRRPDARTGGSRSPGR